MTWFPFLRRGARRRYLDHRESSRAFIATRIAFWCTRRPFTVNRVAVKDHRTMWGSCSSRKNLNFNYRVAHLPPALADYVIVHELCHTVELNHSVRFWAHVASLLPDWRSRRDALRRIHPATLDVPIFGGGYRMAAVVRNDTHMENPIAAGFAHAAQEAVTAVAGGAVLLDVRRDDEWAEGHAVGALHWDLARLEAGEMPDIPNDAHVFVHCAVGGRAGKACSILKEHGWDAVNIGGLSDWEAAGGAVEKTS